MSKYSAELKRLAGVLVLSNLLSLFLFLLRVAATGNTRYWFLIWNLFLAWLPTAFAVAAVGSLYRRYHPVLIAALAIGWLAFLPNSFYILSDLIHLKWTGEINVLFDSVMFFSFILNGFIAGYISVYLIHRQLQKRLTTPMQVAVLGAIFLLCGYAIYLGRELRWNSWDIIANPAGILFDVTAGIMNPLSHPQSILTTMTFFLLISTTYAVIYEVFRVLGPLYGSRSSRR